MQEKGTFYTKNLEVSFFFYIFAHFLSHICAGALRVRKKKFSCTKVEIIGLNYENKKNDIRCGSIYLDAIISPVC